jgi:hypothetical protein
MPSDMLEVPLHKIRFCECVTESAYHAFAVDSTQVVCGAIPGKLFKKQSAALGGALRRQSVR